MKKIIQLFNVGIVLLTLATPINAYSRKVLTQEQVLAISTAIEKRLEHYTSANGIQFTSKQKVTAKDFDTGILNKEGSFERTIKAILGKDGKYRFEITFDTGAAAGSKWIVTYDGETTYALISRGSGGQAIVKKGFQSELSYLTGAVPVLEPFSYLHPSIFSPNNTGTYLTKGLILKSLKSGDWFSDAVLFSESKEYIDIKKELASKLDFKGTMVVSLSSLTFLPSKMRMKWHGEQEKYEDIEYFWATHKIPTIGNELIISKIRTAGVDQSLNITYETLTEIESISFLSDVSPNSWQIDLMSADAIFDADNNLLIPKKSIK